MGVVSLQEEMCIFSFIDIWTLKYTFELFYHNSFSSLILKTTGGLLSLYHVLFFFLFFFNMQMFLKNSFKNC